MYSQYFLGHKRLYSNCCFGYIFSYNLSAFNYTRLPKWKIVIGFDFWLSVHYNPAYSKMGNCRRSFRLFYSPLYTYHNLLAFAATTAFLKEMGVMKVPSSSETYYNCLGSFFCLTVRIIIIKECFRSCWKCFTNLTKEA
jgi:hypothetical protein